MSGMLKVRLLFINVEVFDPAAFYLMIHPVARSGPSAYHGCIQDLVVVLLQVLQELKLVQHPNSPFR